MQEDFGAYCINDDSHSTDLGFVHRELANSYWARDIPFETVLRAVENSLCFNVFLGDKQVAFARVITDKATYAYLCDVIVTEAHQRKGIGKALMAFIMKHKDLRGLRRFTLATRDAHRLYEQFGFKRPEDPSRWMEIVKRDIYKEF
jgi:GNAT superfamily N-acetyltransferase